MKNKKSSNSLIIILISFGKIDSIGNDKYNTSIYATVTPFADVSEIRQVMVITDFEGQGNVIYEVGE